LIFNTSLTLEVDVFRDEPSDELEAVEGW